MGASLQMSRYMLICMYPAGVPLFAIQRVTQSHELVK